MIQEADLKRIKELNRVQRVLHRKSNFLNKDLVFKLIATIRMLKKQKKYLQTKLREKYDTETKKNKTL